MKGLFLISCLIIEVLFLSQLTISKSDIFEVDHEYHDRDSYLSNSDFENYNVIQEEEIGRAVKGNRKICQVCGDVVCEELFEPRFVGRISQRFEWNVTCNGCRRTDGTKIRSSVRKEDVTIFEPKTWFSECYIPYNITIHIGCARCHRYIADKLIFINEGRSCI